MAELFFRDAQALFRILVVGISAYICLILLLRISGKRTLSKMNAFDFVVTVALGSTLATILLSKDVTLAQGVVAFAVLIGAQYIVTWTSVRYEWIRGVMTGEPLMLAYQGQLLPQAMKKARVTESEITAAIRSQGLPGLQETQAVVLETDGSFSVLPHREAAYGSLENVKKV